MRTTNLSLGAFFAILVTAGGMGVCALAQPSLDPPPGPVAESARFGLGTAISLANTPGDADSHFRITESGSYYLTGNLLTSTSGSAIEVAADHVVIDLNGFQLSCTTDFSGAPVTTQGIFADTVNVVIRNGTVRGFRLAGINAAAAGAVRVENVHSIGNGSMAGMFPQGTGFSLGPGSAIVRCTAFDNLNIGISVQEGSSVLDCVSYDNGNVGISAADSLVAHCSAFGHAVGNIDIGATSSTLVGNHAP
jgi:hypothetical protein